MDLGAGLAALPAHQSATDRLLRPDPSSTPHRYCGERVHDSNESFTAWLRASRKWIGQLLVAVFAFSWTWTFPYLVGIDGLGIPYGWERYLALFSVALAGSIVALVMLERAGEYESRQHKAIFRFWRRAIAVGIAFAVVSQSVA